MVVLCPPAYGVFAQRISRLFTLQYSLVHKFCKMHIYMFSPPAAAAQSVVPPLHALPISILIPVELCRQLMAPTDMCVRSMCTWQRHHHQRECFSFLSTRPNSPAYYDVTKLPYTTRILIDMGICHEFSMSSAMS